MDEQFAPTLMEQILHYGLLLGAVFQLICIAAIFTSKSSYNSKKMDDSDGEDASPGNASPVKQAHGHRRNKHERKKRR
ncbi:PREDICTED: protein MANBAL-like [Priapulus caudatus]|uniref:Protein MANBAL-like n=1 Tax=Priapulus caudatus TaxID=37621 RepID=A0ABM1ELX1_PRICU|nr:PREDICTED: protein MANBAL-like [Priapulus caudatus]